MIRKILVLFAMICLSANTSLYARDWFVRAGSDGDGSKEKPFKDPWQALEKAKSEDVVHVAKGRYFGRLEIGKWEMKDEDITLLGGYDETFTQRDPWTHLTILGPSSKSKDRGNYGNIINITLDSIVDGFVFDGREFQFYDSSRDSGYPPLRVPSSGTLVFVSGTLRNSVILNSGGQALSGSGNHLILENNLIMGGSSYMVQLRSNKATIKGNTLLFSTGNRGNDGDCMYVANREATTIVDNVFAFCQGAGMRIPGVRQDYQVDNNVFWMNEQSAMTVGISGSGNVELNGDNMSEIGDMGFGSAKGNAVRDIGSTALDKGWMERYINAKAENKYSDSKIKPEDWSQLRTQLNLPAPGGPKGVGMAYSIENALLLLSSSVPQGAHRIKIEPKQNTGTTNPDKPAAATPEQQAPQQAGRKSEAPASDSGTSGQAICDGVKNPIEKLKCIAKALGPQ